MSCRHVATCQRHFQLSQPIAIVKHYKGVGTIDRHNRLRADELRLDRNLGTKHWDKRFKLGVLGIICVDAYLFFQQVVSANNSSRTSSSTTKGFGGESGRRPDCDTYSQEDSQEEGQGESLCAGEMQTQNLHEANSLCLQHVHEPHRPRP